MKTIFVRIHCELGQTYNVATAIYDRIEETYEVYSTSGDFDLMARFVLAQDQSIGRFVNDKVHAIKGIRDTYTIVAFDALELKKDPLST